MLKVIHSADWHICLNKKKVPYDWQKNRFNLFFDKILGLENETDIHIIAGDVFDKKPEPDEIALFLTWAHRVKIPTYIIDGNHEATSKGKTFLTYFCQENTINNNNIHIITQNQKLNYKNCNFTFMPYCEMKLNYIPICFGNEILVSHIRGEIPPHVSAEYDFNKIEKYKLILLGDLHNNHKYKHYNAYYSGSPVNTTFDRTNDKQYGINLIEFHSIDNYKVNFLDLKLPKLIRKTISSKEQMTPTDYDYTIYEVEGSMDELSKVENNELLDKRIAHRPNESSKINLKNMTLVEELETWMHFNKIENVEEISKEYKELGIA